MQAFDLSQLVAEHAQTGDLYLEFLRVPSLSAGLYRLPAGGRDPQVPHTEDEVYYVVDGRGAIQVGNERRDVAPGTLIFVPAGVEHCFDAITEDLTVVVFFAPAERTPATP